MDVLKDTPSAEIGTDQEKSENMQKEIELMGILKPEVVSALNKNLRIRTMGIDR